VISVSSLRLDRLREAARDLRFLLNRGYPKERATDFAAGRYLLRRPERNAIYRSVFSDRAIRATRAKRVGPHAMRNRATSVDGFNVINTLLSIQAGGPLILCDDGVVRDITAVHGRFRLTPQALEAAVEMVETLRSLGVSRAMVYYDAQISRSGDMASATRSIMEERGLNGLCSTQRSVDHAIAKDRGVAVTSDSAILARVDSFFDLPAYLAKKRSQSRLVISIS